MALAAKTYFLKFGSGDPRPNTGLAPTFLQFFDSTGQTYAPPSVAEVKYGGATNSGIYGFSYLIGQSTTNALYFLAYSVTTVASGFTNDQYITGVLDPVLAVDQSVLGVSTNLANQGTSLLALGSTILSLGTTFLAFGTSFGAVSSTILSLGAFNASFIGSTASSFGTTSTDPTSVFGYLKRIQELMEGDQVFFAAGGTLQLYNRTGLGTTTLLRTKDVLNTGASVTKNGL